MYLQKLYLKNFLTVIIGLEGLYTLIDYVQNQHKIPESANMQILYIYYASTSALSYTVPLSLVLALIISLYSLLTSNRLLAFSALGYSKKKILTPFLLDALIVVVVHISLSFTQVAYAKERADAILNNTYFSSKKEDIFLHYKNSYIYFGNIIPLKKEATNIKIYTFTKDREIDSIIIAKRAIYKDNAWLLKDVVITDSTDDFSKPIIKSELEELSVLEGFKPKILDALFEKELKLSIGDAFSSLKLFGEDSLNINKIKTMLYYQLFFPFFALGLMVITLYYTPLIGRFVNLNMMVFLQILFMLTVWGVLFSLVNLGLSSVLKAEVAVVLPLFLLLILSLLYYNKLEKV